MTITYDPADPAYLDEADVRAEMTRTFDICQGCRSCVDLCSVFPTLFEMIDRHSDHDPGRLTPAQQDRAIDECIHCNRCSDDCPYTPKLHELQLDVPRLVLRVKAMQYTTGITSMRSKARIWLLGRPKLVGRVAKLSSSIADRVAGEPAACTVGGAGCCGAPSLNHGDIIRFTRVAKRNTKLLAAEIRSGADIVISDPLCARVVIEHYPLYAGGPDAELIAAHTFIESEFLSQVDKPGPPAPLDT